MVFVFITKGSENMAKKRANGEGNIRKRSDGRWEGRYTVGYDENGKIKTKSVLAKTQAEVKEKLRVAIAEAGKTDVIKAETYTVGTWIDFWLETYEKIKIRPSTYKTYLGFIENHIKPSLGDTNLRKLTTVQIQQFYQQLLSNGRVERVESNNQAKGLSPKTVRNLNQMLSAALDCAVEQKLICSNPAKSCVLPKVEKQEMKTIPLDKLGQFFSEAKQSGVYELYYIELATGLRRGELLGLKWDDVDWKNGVIYVRRQIIRQDGKVIAAPLKTKNSYRCVAIGSDAIAILKEKQIKENGLSDYIFPSPTGGPISPDSVLHMLQRVLKRAGLEKIRFHDLRHTFATMALQNGVDVKTLSGMLGHYSAGFTLDTYAHVTTTMQTNAAKVVASFLSDAAR